ncbi:MAG: hypothetical protein WBW81_12850 [Methylocella sp.]
MTALSDESFVKLRLRSACAASGCAVSKNPVHPHAGKILRPDPGASGGDEAKETAFDIL